jgi:two-component system cell cycle response regulator CpdR
MGTYIYEWLIFFKRKIFACRPLLSFNHDMAHILIAEDDSSMRHFLAMALERAGHSVRACADGLEALSVLKGEEAFDLLLADIVMPGLDGIELSQKAVSARPGLKVMFITGFAAVAMGHRNPVKETETRILSKPFHLKDLVDQVESLLAA